MKWAVPTSPRWNYYKMDHNKLIFILTRNLKIICVGVFLHGGLWANSAQPNILLILADDLGLSLIHI